MFTASMHIYGKEGAAIGRVLGRLSVIRGSPNSSSVKQHGAPHWRTARWQSQTVPPKSSAPCCCKAAVRERDAEAEPKPALQHLRPTLVLCSDEQLPRPGPRSIMPCRKTYRQDQTVSRSTAHQNLCALRCTEPSKFREIRREVALLTIHTVMVAVCC